MSLVEVREGMVDDERTSHGRGPVKLLLFKNLLWLVLTRAHRVVLSKELNSLILLANDLSQLLVHVVGLSEHVSLFRW